MERQTMNHHRGAGRNPGDLASAVPLGSNRARGGHRVQCMRRLGLAFVLALFTFPVACAPGIKTKTVTWQEEVKLGTGEVIVVERETRFRPSGGEPFRGSGWAADVMTIRFRYPPDAKDVIEWRTVRYGDRHYSTPEMEPMFRDIGPGKGGPHIKGYSPEYPLLLDVEQETKSLYVIALAAGNGACDEYWRYRYDNGQWKDDMLPEVFEKRPANLFRDAEKLTTPNFVNLELNSKSGQRKNIRFRQIGPDRCLCGTINNPVKSGCLQKYQSTPPPAKE